MRTDPWDNGASGSRLISCGLLLTLLLLTIASRGSAQQSQAPQAVEPTETLRVESDLVDLQVSVLNHDPLQPAGRLLQADFQIFEDGAPQDVLFFATADTPFDLVLLLDLSGSSADKLKLIRRSSKRFVKAARPSDRIAIATFTDTVQLVSRLTSDRKELWHAIDSIEKPRGGTNFWDALRHVLAVIVRPEQTMRRSAVVVMTDGVDNALPDVFGEGSRTTFEELLNVVKASNAVVYPIYLDTEPEEVKLRRTPQSAYLLARGQLAQIAAASGTEVYRANKLKDLEHVYEQVIRDLGTVYSLGYRPRTGSRDGKWHDLSVQVANHPGLTARTRSGYYAKVLIPQLPN